MVSIKQTSGKFIILRIPYNIIIEVWEIFLDPL